MLLILRIALLLTFLHYNDFDLLNLLQVIYTYSVCIFYNTAFSGTYLLTYTYHHG